MNETHSDLPESVFFYTFHKCASTLFASYVLRNIVGLRHVDYAMEINSGRRSPEESLTFEENGCIYGPIRMSVGKEAPEGRLIGYPTTEPEFIRDKTAIFLVRDPRDILVSTYFSFCYSHPLSKVKEIRDEQIANRNRLLALTLDGFVLNDAEYVGNQFLRLYETAQLPKRSVILKYEDMVDDFENFMEKFRGFVTLEDAVVETIYDRTRPREEEDIYQHKRSGKVGGFRDKLEANTIEALNQKLEEVLTRFEYEP